MAEQRHPIKPLRELVYSFLHSNPFTPPGMTYEEFIATHFAQKGADQELEACVEWVAQWCGRWPDGTRPEDELRAARRPKPTEKAVTKQQAQLLDEAFDQWWHNEGSGMPPTQKQDHEEHVKSIARIAWHNGAYVKLHHIQSSFTP